MAPDTQSIDCNATFLTLGPALSHPFDDPIDDPEYADRETLSAAIKRVDLMMMTMTMTTRKRRTTTSTKKMTRTRMTKTRTTRNEDDE